ncbi:NADH-dependent phenylglyoxylate dehydrogenase subunit gamma [archaeon BMS3Abin16]|nr:NADH-dependent phenylglyoxylate dehydrogenase subunit gamma [archaeon BMS3Abin16]GBE57045.1 NADH-dependent phenylglyoxylate dehydrogenase subunit gamma [archaeon BMS3Bbin16]
MIEIRFHGRGGQGVVTAADLLAMSAFYDEKYCQAFPSFGVERRGAPVLAFARMDDKPVRRRNQVARPDYVLVQDSTLLDVIDVSSGLKEGGTVIINTSKNASEIELASDATLYTVDGTKIALDVLGRPIVNTVMLGIFSGITGEVSIDGVKKAVEKRFSGKLQEKNLRAVEIAFEKAGEVK